MLLPSRQGHMAKTSGSSNLFPAVKFSQFTIGEEIGETGPGAVRGGPSGRFKRICKGTFKQPHYESQRDIVVLRYARIGDAEKQREVEIWALLAKNPDTPKFIPEIFGACEEKPERLVLQERAHYGSLKTALAEGSNMREAFSPPHRLHAAFQISRAMVFLESLRIVHCDLSCRNCLLFHLDEEDESVIEVKITDMGLAFVLPEGTTEIIKKQPQAVRWCAPETVALAKLSHKADAWSVGMTVWELWSGGANPWPFRERRSEISAILRGIGDPDGDVDAANVELEAIPAAPNGEGPIPFHSMEDEMPMPDCAPHGISCPKPVNDVIRGALCINEHQRKGLGQLMKDFGDIIRSLQQPPERGGHDNGAVAAANASAGEGIEGAGLEGKAKGPAAGSAIAAAVAERAKEQQSARKGAGALLSVKRKAPAAAAQAEVCAVPEKRPRTEAVVCAEPKATSDAEAGGAGGLGLGAYDSDSS
mmetsp:Transcript_16317/g.42927  ORF Transcript_16317/g.42927 Transcript_16317/m.42927 type:complete len:476 (-) Transcript_16317:49-1476(-)